MNNTHPIPYEILLERYTESQREIEYLEYKISALNNEIDAWQKAYEDVPFGIRRFFSFHIFSNRTL